VVYSNYQFLMPCDVLLYVILKPKLNFRYFSKIITVTTGIIIYVDRDCNCWSLLTNLFA